MRWKEDGGIDGGQLGQSGEVRTSTCGDGVGTDLTKKVTLRAKIGDWWGSTVPGHEGQAEKGCKRQALDWGNWDVLIQEDVGWERTILANYFQASQWREERGVGQPQSTGDPACRCR